MLPSLRQARSILGLVAKTMVTKFEFQMYAAGKLLVKSEAANAFRGELDTLVHKHMEILRLGPGVMFALTQVVTEGCLGGISDDSETIHDKLPSRVGAHKAIGWATRVHEGESFEEISSNTHFTDAETVAKAVGAAATYIDLNESEDTSTE